MHTSPQLYVPDASCQADQSQFSSSCGRVRASCVHRCKSTRYEMHCGQTRPSRVQHGQEPPGGPGTQSVCRAKCEIAGALRGVDFPAPCNAVSPRGRNRQSVPNYTCLARLSTRCVAVNTNVRLAGMTLLRERDRERSYLLRMTFLRGGKISGERDDIS